MAERKDEGYWTPLHYAAWKGHGAVVKLLLQQTEDVNSQNDNGNTSLHVAVHYGQEAVVKLLLKRKDIDEDSRNKYGYTPLLTAVSYGHEVVMKLLLERKNIDATSRNNSDDVGWETSTVSSRWEHPLTLDGHSSWLD